MGPCTPELAWSTKTIGTQNAQPARILYGYQPDWGLPPAHEVEIERTAIAAA